MIRHMLFTFLIGCGGIIPNPTPTEITCNDVCVHWQSMGCEEGQPTNKGTTCEEWCDNAAEVVRFRASFECIVQSSSCDESRQCE